MNLRTVRIRLALLRALSRFDSATTTDLDGATEASRGALHRTLVRFAEEGLAIRESKGAGSVASYRITDKGREEIKRLSTRRAA